LPVKHLIHVMMRCSNVRFPERIPSTLAGTRSLSNSWILD